MTHPAINRARETLRRLEVIEHQFADDLAARGHGPDALERWEAMRPKPEPEKIVRKHLTDSEAARLDASAWSMVEALADESGAAVGQLERRLNEAIKRIDCELGEMRADLQILRAI